MTDIPSRTVRQDAIDIVVLGVFVSVVGLVIANLITSIAGPRPATSVGLINPAAFIGVIRNLTAFSVMISVVIGWHEMGHLLVARGLGIGVRQFSIGMGPRVVSRTWRNIEWGFRLVPIGGFVTLQGEGAPKEGEVLPADAFFTVRWWKKFLVFVTGPLSSLLLAYLVLVGIYVLDRLPRTGDVLLVVQRALTESAGIMADGIDISLNAMVNLIPSLISAPIETPVAGVPGMMVWAGAAVQRGPLDFLLLLAVISLSVGVVNLLPIPPFDGGGALLALVEAPFRGRFPKKLRLGVQIAGGVAVLALLLSVTIVDLIRTVSGIAPY